MFSMGPVYQSFSKTSSDFFRGGGGMLWWIVGTSSFMIGFTAWAFTGGAAKIYETGTFILILFLCNVVAMVFCYFFVAVKYRQMRIITVMDGVRRRFGKFSEQFFTWLLLVTRIIYGGLGLYTIAVFMTGVFGISMSIQIVVLGAVVTFMTVIGGSWAAIASDFVQMLMVFIITILMAVLTVMHPQIGGITEFWNKIPSHHFNWTQFDRGSVIIFFFATLIINQLVQMNSLIDGASRYVFAKNGTDVKKALIIPIIGGFLMPIIWLIPPIGATMLFPNLAERYPQLNNPNEAAYIAMAVQLLPAGLLGLLVSAIFAASITTYTGMLTIVSGSFVKNFYVSLVKPSASEKEQIFVGRIVMLVYGVLWILVGLYFQHYKALPLFDLVLILAASIGLPVAVPLFLGILIKKTPSWTGWSSMLIGLVGAIVMRFILTDNMIKILWRCPDLNKNEIDDLNIAITTAVVAFLCFGWFFLSMLFYKKNDSEYVEQVDRFFKEMDTPISETENELDQDCDVRQYRVIANLCIIYGSFLLLLILIPNKLFGRFLIVICGGFMVGAGIILKLIGNHIKKRVLR